MTLDIHTGLVTAQVLLLFCALWVVIAGVKSIRHGQKLLYYRKRQQIMSYGWRLLFVAFFLIISSFLVRQYGAPVVYHYYPPTPTITLTPTITVTPTVTQTSTITATPTITETPSVSPTPYLPQALEMQFTGLVTPNPDAVLSPLQFMKNEPDYSAKMSAVTEFKHPVSEVFGAFSYNNMADGSQWTAVWYRLQDMKIVCQETAPWNGGVGGYGYTNCKLPASEWLPGDYEVQMYVGTRWVVSGWFKIDGDLPASTATPRPSRTPTMTRTPTLTRTPIPTPTITLTPSSTSTVTVTLTKTPRPPTLTPTVTRTPIPTSTMKPTRTAMPSHTRLPTLTTAPEP